MLSISFSPGQILKALFHYSDKKPSFLASHYLYCDRTLVYKWMNDAVILPKKHIAPIVRFAMEHVRPSQREEARVAIEASLPQSRLSRQAKLSIAGAEGFEAFLLEVLSWAVTLKLEEHLELRPQEGAPPLPASRLGTVRLVACGLLAVC